MDLLRLSLSLPPLRREGLLRERGADGFLRERLLLLVVGDLLAYRVVLAREVASQHSRRAWRGTLGALLDVVPLWEKCFASC